MRPLLILCLVLAWTSATADTYRWTDAAGRTIISDVPPPNKVKSVAKLGDHSDESEGLSFALRRAKENFPVTLYTSADCIAECKEARDLLNARGIPFSEKMLQKPEDATELKQLVGDVFIPSLKVGKQSFRGFQASAYNNLLDLAGYPKTAPYGSKPTGGPAPAEKGN